MKKIPVYEFDCRLPPEKRWDALPKYLRTAGRTLARRGVADLAQHKGAVSLTGLTLRVLTKGRNPYREEIKGAANVLGIEYNEATTLNFLYEASLAVGYGYRLWEGSLGDKLRGITATLKRHADRFSRGALACTAGARPIEGLGMTHVRTMDWPVDGLGRHTLILHHVHAPAGNFYSVGWPGYSGVLSGYKPGAFSATINQADVIRLPNLQWPPAHLLRWVFENCRTYAEALTILRNTPVCFPAFILLAGPDKAAVVELGPDGNTVKPMSKGQPIAVANDYLSAKRQKMAGIYGRQADSDHRRKTMLRKLRRLKGGNIRQALTLIQDYPVANEQTMQQMVFAHESGNMIVVGLADEEPVKMAKYDFSKCMN